MRAVRYRGPGQSFELRAVPVPEPGPGEVRVRIGACGLCRTELHLRDGLLDLGRRDFTVGHEVAGIIEAAGPGVPENRIGERVAVYYYEGCLDCPACRAGEENLCARPLRQAGFTSDGGCADRLVVRARNCVPLPGHVTLEHASVLGCAGTTAVHACRLAGISAGDRVVVHGTGGVGFALIQVARAQGARVVALGRGADRMALCRELGAEDTVDLLAEADVAARVAAIAGEAGVRAVFELVGLQDTMALSASLLGRHGRMVLIGYSAESLMLHPIGLIVREASLVGSVGATLAELHEAVSLASRGKLRIPLDRVLPLERFEDGLHALEHGRLMGRVVLTP